MTEVRKPGANSKVASGSLFPTRNSEWLVINTLPIF